MLHVYIFGVLNASKAVFHKLLNYLNRLYSSSALSSYKKTRPC